MNTGTTTPNWADLVFHLSELSTYEYFELAQNWSSDIPPMVPESNWNNNPYLDRITNPDAGVLNNKTVTDTVIASTLPSVPTGMLYKVPDYIEGLNSKSTFLMSTH